jgi:hypothetical protein
MKVPEKDEMVLALGSVHPDNIIDPSLVNSKTNAPSKKEAVAGEKEEENAK